MPDILQGLNSAQREAVLATEGPILIIAGPGSGKTRCLTHKIAYLVEEAKVSPEQILAVTFTNKAANEMAGRIKSLVGGLAAGLWVGTFHATCARILRMDGSAIGIARDFVIYDEDDSLRLIKKLESQLRISEKEAKPSSVLNTIASAKDELVGADNYSNYAFGYFQERVAKIYPAYQTALAENHALDFGDLIFKVVALFETRPEILAKWQERFRYVLVDEYQDTNRAQYVLIKLLAGKHHNLAVVGDVSQAIYGWRGADFRNILNFERDWPEAKIFRLEQNYRSTQKIINAAREVIRHNRTHLALDLWTENSPGEGINLYEASSEKDEAQYVVQRIQNCESRIANESDPSFGIHNSPFTKFAILYRTNAQSRVLEETLVRAGVPYQLVGGVRFYERREIKDVLSYLRVLENPRDKLSWERIINVPPRGVGKKAQAELEERGWPLEAVAELLEFPLEKLLAEKAQHRPDELLDIVLDKTGYLRWLDDRSEEGLSRIENVKELRSVASQFTALGDFLENVALVENVRNSRGRESLHLPSGAVPPVATPVVTLMTLHAAKGLEFPTVFIVGLEEGLLPHSRSLMDAMELEEERRLFYVGMTRAREELHLTYARERLFFGGDQLGRPSRFLFEIPEELLVPGNGGTSVPSPEVDSGDLWDNNGDDGTA